MEQWRAEVQEHLANHDQRIMILEESVRKTPDFHERMDRLEARQESMGAEILQQMSAMNACLARQDTRLDKHDARLDKQDARLDKQDARLDAQDGRLSRIETSVKSLEDTQIHMINWLNDHAARIDARFEQQTRELKSYVDLRAEQSLSYFRVLQDSISELGRRFERLESRLS